MEKHVKQRQIAIRMWISIILMTLVIGLLLFVSAGSFRFWKGWVVLAEFIGSSVAISLYFFRKNPEFIKKRLQAGPFAETERSQQIIQGGSSIAFISLLVTAGLDYRFHWSSVALPFSVAGNVALLLGFYIVYIAFHTNSFASSIIEKQKKQYVVQKGIYTVIRHPMYLGASLVVGGMPWALGSQIGWISIAGMGIFLVARILHEEQYLRLHLPGYAAYCRQVRYRLFPNVW